MCRPDPYPKYSATGSNRLKRINNHLEEGEKVLHLEAGTNLVVDQSHQFRLSQPHQSLAWREHKVHIYHPHALIIYFKKTTDTDQAYHQNTGKDPVFFFIKCLKIVTSTAEL